MKILLNLLLLPLLLGNFFYSNAQDVAEDIDINANIILITDTSTYPIIQTFLGNWERNYYGENAPGKLNLIWKLYLGKGETVIS